MIKIDLNNSSAMEGTIWSVLRWLPIWRKHMSSYGWRLSRVGVYSKLSLSVRAFRLIPDVH